MDDPPTPPDPSLTAPTRAPLARVALVRKRLELAAPVRVVAVEPGPSADRPRARPPLGARCG
jgi:hypothetical protein